MSSSAKKKKEAREEALRDVLRELERRKNAAAHLLGNGSYTQALADFAGWLEGELE